MRLPHIWHRLTSRYTRALEAELASARTESARLRQENRALLNSILGIAGIPPIIVNSAQSTSDSTYPAGFPNAPSLRAGVEAEAPRSTPTPQPGLEAPASGPVSPLSDESAPARTVVRSKNFAQVAAPLRRRSWHQINRALEFEAARKKSHQDATEA